MKNSITLKMNENVSGKVYMSVLLNEVPFITAFFLIVDQY